MSQLTLNDLNKVSFEFEGKVFDVVDVERRLQKNYIRTKQRSFVYYDSDLDVFLSKIKIIEKSRDISVSEVRNVTVVEHKFNYPETTVNITDKLMQMFEKLSGNPTESDYKQADAMSKMADTIIKAEQTKINFVRLQKSV